MSARTILLGRAGSGKTRAVLDRLAEALAAGGGGRSLVLVPTLSQAGHLKRALVSRSRYPGIRGFFDESLVTFTSLAEKILCDETIGELLSGLRQRMMLREVLLRCRLETFRAVSGYAGFRRAALELLKELKQNGLGREETEARLAASIDSLSGVARDRLVAFREVYGRYEDLREEAGLLDHEDYLAACRDRLEAEAASGGRGPRFDTLGVDGFQNFTSLEREILLLLAGASRETTVTLTYDPALEEREGGHFRVSHETCRFLAQHGFRRKVLDGNRRARVQALAGIERRAFDAPAGDLDAEGAVRVLAAADPEDEAERVARTVRRSAADHPYREFLIVARDLSSKRKRFARAFRRHRLPLRIFCGESPAEHPYVRSAMNLLRIAAGDARAERVLALLRSDHFDAIGAAEVDRFEESLAEEGEAATLAEWGVRVGEVSSPAGDALRLVSEWGERRAGEGGEAVSLSSWPDEIRRLLDLVLVPLWRRDLFDEERIRHEAWAHRAFHATLQETVEALRFERGRSGPRGARGLPDLLDLVAEALREVAAPPPDRRLDVVNMVDAREARQWEAEVVFVCGLVEGEFPRSPREDPVLADRERRRLNERGTIALREIRNERDEERFLFYVAVTRPRRRLYLTYPMTDGSGEECARSTYLDDLLAQISDPEGAISARRLADPLPLPAERSGPEDLRNLALDGLTSAEAGPAAALHNLLVEDGPGRDGAYVRAVRRGVRYGRRLRARLSDPAPVDSRHPSARGHSPSSLEDFVTCPFRHFAGRTLRLRAGPSPVGAGVDRGLVGEIGHEVLRRVFEPALRGEPLPPSEEVEEIFGAAARERTVGRSLRLKEDRTIRLLEASIVRLVEDERERIDGSDWKPLALEAPFGRGRGRASERGDPEGGVAVRGEGGREVRLRGRLDRIDAGPGGAGLVIEYKLGRTFAGRTLKEIEEGTELQIPAYLLAVREAFGLRVAGVWITTLLPPSTGGLVMDGTPKPERSFPLSPEGLEEMIEDFGGRVLQIDDRIRAGEILVAPRDRRVCESCDYGDLCRIEAWQGPERSG